MPLYIEGSASLTTDRQGLHNWNGPASITRPVQTKSNGAEVKMARQATPTLVTSYSPDPERNQNFSDCLRELAHDLEANPDVKIRDLRYQTPDILRIEIEGTPDQLDAFKNS